MQNKKEVLIKEFGVLYDEISEILFKQDPIGLNFGMNDDEYNLEVEEILPKLKSCSSALGVRKVVHEVFVKYFSKEIAGPEEYYNDIANQIWMAYHQYLLKST